MCRILVADNELSMVADLEKYLFKEGHQVIGNAVSGRQALEMAKKTRPDLVLMEVKLAGEMDGITTAIRIKEVSDCPIIFLTWYGDKRTLGEARWAHPAAYVLKPFQWTQLNAAIDSALSAKTRDKSNQRESASGWYVNLIRGEIAEKIPRTVAFTPSEIQIVDLIAQGQRTADIARKLKLKNCTVHWHQKNIRRKMGLTGRKKSLVSTLALKQFF